MAARIPAQRDRPVEFQPFRTSNRVIARENVSLITSRGTKRSREIHLANGPDGDRTPVMLIPGFMTGDWSMTPIAHALRSWDFKPARSGILLNVDCTNAVLDRLEARLETLAGRYQRTIPIVGWSRGGVLGKLLALRRPDLVGGLITIASPLAKPLAISSRVVRHIEILMRLSSQGVGGVMTSECIYGACGSEMLESLKMPVPTHIPYISIYSRTDGVIDWTSCLDPSARHIEIHSTHLGIGNSPRVWRLVANELLAMPAPLEQVQAKVS